MKQRSHEWFTKRLGHVTASNFKAVLTEPRSRKDKDAGKLSDTTLGYMRKLIVERWIGEPQDVIISRSLQWGEDSEIEAQRELREREEAIRAANSLVTGEIREADGEWAFYRHPTEEWIGCSPDGVIGDDGLIEIKCPANPVNSVKVLMQGHTAYTANDQCQGQLWITGRQYYLFVCYDSRLKGREFYHEIVQRDDAHIDNILAPGVLRFRDKYLEKYAQLTGVPF